MTDSSITRYGEDINEMIASYGDRGIITQAFCSKQADEALQKLFKEKLQEAVDAFENSKALLGGADRGDAISLPYSECVAVGETACASAKNIQKVMMQRGLISLQESFEYINPIEKQLQNAYQLQPMGKTAIQLKDIELLRQLNKIPTQDIYQQNGELYYQPKVSHMTMREFFETYRGMGKYKSVQTACNQDKFYGFPMKGNFHLVSLIKSKEQALHEFSKISDATGDILEIKSRYHTNSSGQLALPEQASLDDHSQEGMLMATYTGLFRSFEGMLSRTVQSEKEIGHNIFRQESLQNEIASSLPSWNQNEGWDFENFQVLGAKEQMDLGVSPKDAVMADCILLFHKKKS